MDIVLSECIWRRFCHCHPLVGALPNALSEGMVVADKRSGFNLTNDMEQTTCAMLS